MSSSSFSGQPQHPLVCRRFSCKNSTICYNDIKETPLLIQLVNAPLTIMASGESARHASRPDSGDVDDDPYGTTLVRCSNYIESGDAQRPGGRHCFINCQHTILQHIL